MHRRAICRYDSLAATAGAKMARRAENVEIVQMHERADTVAPYDLLL